MFFLGVMMMGTMGAFQKACSYLGLADTTLGVEAEYMRVLELELLQRYVPGVSTVHVDPYVSSLRQNKSSGEVSALKQAVEVAENAHAQPASARPNWPDREANRDYVNELELAKAGSESLAFDPIVAAGPHACVTPRYAKRSEISFW